MTSPQERANVVKKAIHDYAYSPSFSPNSRASHHHPRSPSSTSNANNQNDLSDVTGVTPQVGSTKFGAVYSTTSNTSGLLRHSTGRGAYTPFFPGQYEETLLSEKRSTRTLYGGDADDDSNNLASPHKTLIALTFESKKRSWRARKEANHQLGVLRNELLIEQAKEEMKKFPMLVHKSERDQEKFLGKNGVDQKKKKVHLRLRDSNNRSPSPLQSLHSSGNKKNSYASADAVNKEKIMIQNNNNNIEKSTPTRFQLPESTSNRTEGKSAAEHESEIEMESNVDPDMEQQQQQQAPQSKSVMTFNNNDSTSPQQQQQQHAVESTHDRTKQSSSPDKKKQKKFKPPTSSTLIQLSSPPQQPHNQPTLGNSPSSKKSLPPTSPTPPSNSKINADDDIARRRRNLIAAAHAEKALRVASQQMEALRCRVSRSAARATWLRDGISRLDNEQTRLASVMDEPPIVAIVEFERTVERPRREARLKEQRKQPLHVVDGNGDEVDDVIKGLMDAEAHNRKNRERRLKEEREQRAHEALQRRMALQKAKMDAEREEAEKNGEI